MSRDDTIDEFENSAGGLDHDDPIRERAAAMGATLIEDGPGALLEEVEELLPKRMRDQIVAYPVTAMLLGLGVGLYLGMRRSDQIISAGTAMLSTAAAANVSKVFSDIGK